MIGKVHLPSQTNLHTFFLNHLPPCPPKRPFPPLTFNHKIKCHSQDMTIHSPQHMTIPTNTVCHNQLIDSFFQTQHQHQVLRSFLYLSCTPHIALTEDRSVLCKIQISLSFRHNASLPYSIARHT